ncbi:MAG: hypothetical protein Q8L53_09865 [Aestuariivirga sp.]|nr:hypothetical protein [Aestuariivirga sp.]
MALPRNSQDAERYIALAKYNEGDSVRTATYVFDAKVTLKEIFQAIFTERRSRSILGDQELVSIELLPDYHGLPIVKPRSMVEAVLEDMAPTEENIVSF